jgi:hypothetical protein
LAMISSHSHISENLYTPQGSVASAVYNHIVSGLVGKSNICPPHALPALSVLREPGSAPRRRCVSACLPKQ